MCNMCSVRCGAASRTLSRVRERSVAAVQWESAGRREPPACLRATGARADARAPPAPRARHAPPAPAHAGRALLTTSPSPSRSGLTHHAIIDVFCEMCRAEQGPRGAARTAGRGGGPARCVTHLSRRFLACSRSPPSAETCSPGSGRAHPAHCDGVNALREILRITSVKLNRAELSDVLGGRCGQGHYFIY